MVLLFLLLFSVGMEIFQNDRIYDLEKKLELLEPIIDDYCISNPNRLLDFCGETLEGYNEREQIVNVFP